MVPIVVGESFSHGTSARVADADKENTNHRKRTPVEPFGLFKLHSFCVKTNTAASKFHSETGAAVMVWRQPLARMILLVIAGVLACFVFALVAAEPFDPWRRSKSLENQRPPDNRLPSPQRRRGVGGEGDALAAIHSLSISESIPRGHRPNLRPRTAKPCYSNLLPH